jgi:hypothetical protein
MELKVLDVRQNPLLSGKVPKTLKNSVILGWDNSMQEKTIESIVGKSDITSGGEGVSPFIIVRASEGQRELM